MSSIGSNYAFKSNYAIKYSSLHTIYDNDYYSITYKMHVKITHSCTVSVTIPLDIYRLKIIWNIIMYIGLADVKVSTTYMSGFSSVKKMSS